MHRTAFRFRTCLPILLGLGLVSCGPEKLPDPHLSSFQSCTELADYYHAQLPAPVQRAHDSTPKLTPFTSTTPGTTSIDPTTHRSTTVPNSQAFEGLQSESDLRIEGHRLFSLDRGNLRILDIGGKEARLLRTIDLKLGRQAARVFVDNNLITLVHAYRGSEPASHPFTRIQQLDATGTGDPRLIAEIHIQGRIRHAMQLGSQLHLVLENKVVGTKPNGQALLPQLRISVPDQPQRNFVGSLHSCEQFFRSGIPTNAGATSFVTFDMHKGTLNPAQAFSVFGRADQVYATEQSVYVASSTPPPSRASTPSDKNAPTDDVEGGPLTVIHRFEQSNAGPLKYRSSGQVPGSLLLIDALKEINGLLHVATLRHPWSDKEAGDTVISNWSEQGKELKPQAEIGGLGGRREVYRSRFQGETGYIETAGSHRRLRRVDLRDANHLVERAALPLEPYQAFLHPISPNLLLATSRSYRTYPDTWDLVLSLIDIQDPHAPKILHQQVLNSGYANPMILGHEGFAYSPETKTALLPIYGHTNPQGEGNKRHYETKLVTIDLASGFQFHPNLVHGNKAGDPSPTPPMETPIYRALLQGTELWTASRLGVQRLDLKNRKVLEWIPFPKTP